MSTEQQPTAPSAPSTTSPTPQASQEQTFQSLKSYPFETDQAFLSGLSQILGHPNTPPSQLELQQKPDLVLSAKCFYFNRKFQSSIPIEPATYKAWLASSSTTSEPAVSNSPTSRPQNPTPVSASQPPTEPQATEPPYPTSFAAIVDLITNNKPIPGIEEIPTTVLEPGSSKQDRATKRRKPWEKDEEVLRRDGVNPDAPVAGQEINASEGENGVGDTLPDRGEGLLRLLRSDAVPDSGLVAKD